MSDHLKFSWQPELKNPSLIIGWSVDASKLGTRVAEYLINKLGGRSFCEFEPVEFFPLGGVTIEDNLVQFPESRFYACPDQDLIVLKSDPPSANWYGFLSLVLEVAAQFNVKELYACGGMISLNAHTAPRGFMGTFTSAEFKSAMSGYGMDADWDYESPAGQRPTLNSFLLWSAKRRNIPAVSVWAFVPFYLSGIEDAESKKKQLDFFNRRFSLALELNDIEQELTLQNQKLTDLRSRLPEVDRMIKKLENSLQLSDEESHELVKEVEQALG